MESTSSTDEIGRFGAHACIQLSAAVIEAEGKNSISVVLNPFPTKANT